MAALLPMDLLQSAGQFTGVSGSLALLAVALGALWLLSRQQDWAKLPGPKPGSWLLGHLPQINTPAVHRFFQDAANQYGGMFRLRLLNKKIVVVSDPGLVQTLFSKQAEVPKAPEVYDASLLLFSPSGRRSLFHAMDLEEWRLVRKATAPAFSMDNIRKAFPATLKITQEASDLLAGRVAAGQGEAEVDVSELGMRVTLDVIGNVAYGYDFNARAYGACELLEIMAPLLAEMNARATNPLRALAHRMLPILPEARLFNQRLQACYRWWATLLAAVKSTDLSAAEAEGDTSLRVCLARLDVPDDLLLPQVALFLVAGFETTAHSVAWTLYEIAANPAVQQRMAAELAGRGLLGPAARPLEFADLAQLSYLNCVLKESLRLHPVTALGGIRKADREMELGGYRLPKGTLLWAPFISIHTSKHNWQRPNDFWPKRWEAAPSSGGAGSLGGASAGGAGSLGGASAGGAGDVLGSAPTPVGHASNPAKSYIPFSDGPRDCIGQNLALMESRAVLAALVGRFELSLAPRMGSREDVRASEVMKVTLHSSTGIHLRMKLRS